MNSHQVAVVVGAGAGLGNALVTRFADEGMRVAALSRSGGAGQPHLDEVRGYSCDATISGQVKEAFARVRSELGPPSLVVFNVGIWDQGGILDISEDLFEQAWRTGCFAGFLVGRAAAASMLDSGGGTIIFSGATGSIRGGAGFAAFASPKFALRALAQAMARETRPKEHSRRARHPRRHDRAGGRFLGDPAPACGDRGELLSIASAGPQRVDP
ncbi:SDR family NAD(P)-dependent oxidoreductase [Bradyrhizobium guangxiense]